MHNVEEPDDEQPLDPAAERVRKKMIRLLAVSIGIMMAGLMAVLAAIVYKIGETDGRIADNGGKNSLSALKETGNLDLPDGANIRSVDLDGQHILFHVELLQGGNRIFVFDLVEGRVVSSIVVE
jgi:hypothetical protein